MAPTVGRHGCQNADAALLVAEHSQVADELRTRVFELRCPNRDMYEEGADRLLVQLFDQLRDTPSTLVFYTVLAEVLLPAMHRSYTEYMTHSDPLADAPTHRFIKLALSEKEEQTATLTAWVSPKLH